jgi:hypothetical protein
MESIETKALIIAALLHDANHQGNKNDAVNIEASLACAENIIYDIRTSNLIGKMVARSPSFRLTQACLNF